MTTIGILSVEDVARIYRDVQIIDARPKSAFEAGHIPGAIWMGWEDWCESAPVSQDSILREAGYWGVLRQASAAWYAERLASCGLHSSDPIIIYAGGPHSRGREGRIAWMLLYLGVSGVMLLDGGWQAWLQIGRDVEREHTMPPPGHFPVNFQHQRRRVVADLVDELQSSSRPLLVDTRSAAEFAGESQPYMPRRGHLPGAVLVPFTTLFGATERYVDRESYVDRLPPGIQQADRIVAYCEVGVRASLFALLHEAYTGQLVPVCDGSLMEWTLMSDLPLQIGMTS